MERQTSKEKKSLSTQVKAHAKKKNKVKEAYTGNTEIMISTGSTLLDLAISGKRKRGGGLPKGILVEIFGPSGSGKTVLLCEIAGAVSRTGGNIMFHDPEARLNKQFASLFDFNTDEIELTTPDTIPQVFNGVRTWDVKDKKDSVNGIFADSLAALSTNLEMENKEGDKMGMRRAKEFSEELRKTCRILTDKNLLMVCSNQVRVNMDAGPYGQKYVSPGGESIGFYSSVRLRMFNPKKIKIKKRIGGKEVERIIGITTEIEVYKNSVSEPYKKAPLTILFDYGIDDIRQNLQYIKDFTKNTVYMVNDTVLDKSMDESIKIVEDKELEKELKEQTIDLWEKIESKFESNRTKKR